MLDLEHVYCRTILENKSALAFQDSFGVERTRVLPRYFRAGGERNGRLLDAVEGRLTRARWNTLRENTLAKAARAAAWSLP
jgi:RimJ/RimL family protein N-acetyltransferase